MDRELGRLGEKFWKWLKRMESQFEALKTFALSESYISPRRNCSRPL
ncbi:MAG: hypothetical protein KatS3mg109_2032 [Pirellulaceae bacterium]|nr:MAG: hypothetical protein KatS3mg109_2032 [Pirellulaceae bacterium]